MRVFLIIFSYLNLFFYLLLYALYDYIFKAIGLTGLSAGIQSFTKVALLVIAGFLIGLIASLFKSTIRPQSTFDYNLFLVLGIVPFILLLLSEGSMSDFIIRNFFNSSKMLSEAAFYIFSRTSVYGLWYGFSIGISTIIVFRKKTKTDYGL